MSAALVLVAGALLAWPPVDWPLRRLSGEVVTPVAEVPAAADPFAEAAAFDLLAVCLSSGLSGAASASAVAESSTGGLAASLRRVADLLALGTDAGQAWQREAGDRGGFDDLAALVRRTASSGAAFADGLTELARRRRDDAGDAAVERAERAGVRISGPLGLCFLPAFVCLGIAPVVIGLASSVLGDL